MTRITPAASAWPKRWEESPATLGPFLTVTFAERPDLLVIQPSGRLDGASAPQFESLVMERIATHRAAVEFDLRKVRVITSAGLRVILMAARTLRNGDRAVTIEGLHGNTREVFETSGFLSLFPGQPSAAATVPVTVRSVRPYIRPGQEPPAPVTVAG